MTDLMTVDTFRRTRSQTPNDADFVVKTRRHEMPAVDGYLWNSAPDRSRWLLDSNTRWNDASLDRVLWSEAISAFVLEALSENAVSRTWLHAEAELLPRMLVAALSNHEAHVSPHQPIDYGRFVRLLKAMRFRWAGLDQPADVMSGVVCSEDHEAVERLLRSTAAVDAIPVEPGDYY